MKKSGSPDTHSSPTALSGTNKLPRLKDVAKEAGVSIGAVSIILNSPEKAGSFSEACKKRVRDAALKLNYHRNYHASIIRKRRHPALGLAVWRAAGSRTLGNSHYSMLLAGLYDAAFEKGYEIVVIHEPFGKHGQKKIEKSMTYYYEGRVSGVIVPTTFEIHEVLGNLDSFDGPVGLANYVPSTKFFRAYWSEETCMHLAVDHLRQLGHERFLYIGPQNSWGDVGKIRINNFARLMAEHSFLSGLCIYGPDHPPYWEGPPEYLAPAYEVIYNFLKEKSDRFTAAICYSDWIGNLAANALRELGKTVPGDCSIVAFDDRYAAYMHPPLTAVELDVFKLGQILASRMIESIETGAPLTGKEVLEPTLSVRQSTGPVK